MKYEYEHADGHEDIGEIVGRPSEIPDAHVDEIDDLSHPESVYQVPDRTAQNEDHRGLAGQVPRVESPGEEEIREHHGHDEGDREHDVRTAESQAECHTGITDIVETNEITYHGAEIVDCVCTVDGEFRGLVHHQDEEKEDGEEDLGAH